MIKFTVNVGTFCAAFAATMLYLAFVMKRALAIGHWTFRKG